MSVSAPGKALLCGEYAVVDGSPAVVAAVDRRVVAYHAERAGAESQAPGPETEASLRAAKREFGDAEIALRFDSTRLFQSGKKIGLGSSAAASVAAAGSVAVHHGHTLDDPALRRRVFSAAFDGHRAVSPEGSGVDVASAAYGGFLVFAKRAGTEVQLEAIEPPRSLVLSLIWTGRPVRTSDLLDRVRQLRASRREAYDRLMRALHERTLRFVEAFRRSDEAEVIVAARDYHQGMRELGLAADAPIVDDSLEKVATWAGELSGAAKPCGAGGGDVAIGFFPPGDAIERFEAKCASEGLTPIRVGWGAEGVRIDPE